MTVEREGRSIAFGSGVVVASRGGQGGGAVSYVLTAAHILNGKDGSGIFVRFTGLNGVRGRFAASVARRDNPERLDLALLRVAGIAVAPASFADADQVHLGEEILVVGYPWGKRLGLFGGIVSQVPVDRPEEAAPGESNDRTITVDAVVSSGVSGGGVFRAATGGLVGLVEGYRTASIAVKTRTQTYSMNVPMPGETFVVPIVRIRRFLDAAGLDEAPGQPGRTEGQKN